MTLGGRAAEEIVFGEITTGASNDLEKITATAKQMVMRFGMSERLGPRVFGHDHGQPFLGREFSSEPDYSDELAREIDDEIRRIVESAHQRAKDILTEHRDDLERISEILVKRETIEKDEFEALLDGKSEEEVFGPDEEPSSRRRPARAARRRAQRRRRPPAPAAASRPRRRRGPRPRPAREARAWPCSETGAVRRRRSSVMGIVNVTPDSFSDGGRFSARRRRGRARRLLAEGADILDVGGESTRPGAEPVGAEEESARACRSSRRCAPHGARSRSTRPRSRSPRPRSTAGATYVNDVSALRFEPELAGLVADAGVRLLPHAHARRAAHDAGRPALRRRRRRRQGAPGGAAGVRRRARAIAEERIHLDPGIGFGKTVEHNLELLRRLDEIVALGRPVVVGTSRKSFLGRLTGRDAASGWPGRSPRTSSRCAGRPDLPRPRRRPSARCADGGRCYVRADGR